VILAITAAPFITGFLAYHQWIEYRTMLILHILSGETMLMAIPFTRLVHMFYFWFTRAYMGSEFGGVRHARDW
jgi:nitrate reductase gamma subunit